MDETVDLFKIAEQEIMAINDELDEQGEKFNSLQEKLGKHRKVLYENSNAVDKLQNALRMRKFIILILFIMVMFSISFLVIRYLKSGEFIKF